MSSCASGSTEGRVTVCVSVSDIERVIGALASLKGDRVSPVAVGVDGRSEMSVGEAAIVAAPEG